MMWSNLGHSNEREPASQLGQKSSQFSLAIGFRTSQIQLKSIYLLSDFIKSDSKEEPCLTFTVWMGQARNKIIICSSVAPLTYAIPWVCAEGTLSLIPEFSPQMFLECLLCARHSSCWEYHRPGAGGSPCLWGIYILVLISKCVDSIISANDQCCEEQQSREGDRAGFSVCRGCFRVGLSEDVT